MNTQDLSKAYHITHSYHDVVEKTLSTLDENKPVNYLKRVKTIRITAVFLLVFVILSTTVVAAKTEFFGLLSERVGDYGLNITVETQTEKEKKTSDTGVTLDLGYLPDGYESLYDDEVASSVYEYAYAKDEPSFRFTFFVQKTDEFNFEEKFITDYTETEFNGYKTIFATSQLEEDSEENYMSVKYFDDWGYVVTCYCGDYNELKKVTQHLNLKKATKTVSETYKKDVPVDKTEDYGFRTSDEYILLKKGQSFDYSQNVINGENPSDFTITVKSVEERNSFGNLDADCMIYDGIYSSFFDENGELITPYTRKDMSGDGIDSLLEWNETVDDRHFYLVTLDITANTDVRNTFDIYSVWTSKVDTSNESDIKISQKYGECSLVYRERDNSTYTTVEIEKGETLTYTFGVVADDDIVDNACLTIKKRYIDIYHEKQLAVERMLYACVMLNSEVDYD